MPSAAGRRTRMNAPEIIVIGAGPAGMMAAGSAAEAGARVTLIEKNARPGRKLSITGKGRCNITNYCDTDEFIAHLTANPRFMYSALNGFSCYDAVAFFEDHGLSTKVERGNRVFPASDRAQDVTDTLIRYINDAGVLIRQTQAQSLVIGDGAVKGVDTSDGRLSCDAVIVACGGMSYRATGSTGDGYRFAKAAGHTVTPLLPSLIPLVSTDADIPQLQGLSLRNVAIAVKDNMTGEEAYRDFGELLFTHFGLSGPVILSASAHMRSMSPGRYTVTIDLKPALDPETLDRRLLRDLSEYANKDIVNALPALVPKSLIPVILRRADVGEHTKCHAVTAAQRRALRDTLKALSFVIRSFRPINEAIVTHGGVDVREIDPRTMQSKLVDGLYFAGEVLDLDAYTGGFNLQIAYSTGRLAGLSAAKCHSRALL